jgi:hypothetical protein
VLGFAFRDSVSLQKTRERINELDAPVVVALFGIYYEGGFMKQAGLAALQYGASPLLWRRASWHPHQNPDHQNFASLGPRSSKAVGRFATQTQMTDRLISFLSSAIGF